MLNLGKEVFAHLSTFFETVKANAHVTAQKSSEMKKKPVFINESYKSILQPSTGRENQVVEIVVLMSTLQTQINVK